MDDFSNFFLDEDNGDDLTIPAPKPNADIRPSPSPMLLGDANSLHQESAPISPKMDASHEYEQHKVVIKTADFHAPRGSTAEPVHYTERAEDKATAEKASPLNSDENNDAKCFAFMGASGGAGVTTLCIQMAYDIAKRAKKSALFGGVSDPTVCLIDLNFETGSCASYLDVPPALTLEDMCGLPSGIDTSIVQALMSQHESGIAVISTPNALGANTLVNPETVLALLDAASQLYDHIILDLPRIWQPWMGAAILGADHFAIVSELTIPSLHTARTRMKNIENLLGESLSCEVVLNKVERRSFRNSLRIADAEKALQRSVSATICVDYETTREAINCGEAVQVIRPEARYVKDVRELSHKWAPVKSKRHKLKKDRRKKRPAA